MCPRALICASLREERWSGALGLTPAHAWAQILQPSPQGHGRPFHLGRVPSFGVADVCTWARVYRSSVRSLPSTFACTPGQQRGDPNPTRTERSWPLSSSAPPNQRKSPGLQTHGPHPGNPLGQQVTRLQKVPEIIPVAPSHGEQEWSRAGLSSSSRGDRRAIVNRTVSSPRVTQGEKTAQPPPRVLLGGGEPSTNQGPRGLEPPSLRRAGKAMLREGCKISLAPWERSWRTVRTPHVGLRGSQRIPQRGWAGG